MDCLRWLQQGAPARKATREAPENGSFCFFFFCVWGSVKMVLPRTSIGMCW